MSDNNGMIYLGGLWLSESKSGKKYFSGKLGLGGRILIFKNENRTADNQPEYNMYIVPAEQRDAQQDDDENIPF